MANTDIKTEIKAAGLKQWQISDELNMHDSNFCKLLRKEFSTEQKAEVRAIIAKLKAEQERGE